MKRAAIAAATVVVAVGAQPTTAADAAERGRAVFLDRDRGHCLLCHQVGSIDEPFQGDIGPDLSDVGRRLDSRALRDRVADPTVTNPATVMPAYFRTDNLNQVGREWRDRPVLTRAELDDLVVFLTTLRGAETR